MAHVIQRQTPPHAAVRLLLCIDHVCIAFALTAGCAAIANVVLPPEQAAQLGEQMAREIEVKQPLHPSPARLAASKPQAALRAAGKW